MNDSIVNDLDSIYITKVKWDQKKNKIQIDYEKELESSEDSNERDFYSLKVSDEPLDSFFEALNELDEHVCLICEFPLKDQDKLEIKGVSFSWANGIMGAVITALKMVHTARSPLVVNTPHLATAPQSDQDDNCPILDRDTVFALRRVIDEAKLFISGARKKTQLTLDLKAKTYVSSIKAKHGENIRTFSFETVKDEEELANV